MTNISIEFPVVPQLVGSLFISLKKCSVASAFDRETFGLTCFQSQLPTMEGLRAAGGRGALDPPDAVYRLEGVARKPMPGRLALEVFQKEFDLSRTDFLGQWHEDVGMAQITIILRDFVLKDQVIPERVPG